MCMEVSWASGLTLEFPLSTMCLVLWLRHVQPGLKFTSCMVLHECQAELHRDLQNSPLVNIIVPLSLLYLSLVSMFQNCAMLRCSLWLFRSWGKSFFPAPAGTRSETWPRRPRAGF